MSDEPVSANRRILVIDDNRAIHDDFRKILSVPSRQSDRLQQMHSELFGRQSADLERVTFELDFAFQGEEGLEKAQSALDSGAPHAVVFADVRMPPGWDGVETVRRIWKVVPETQAVICTAYADYSLDEISRFLGRPDQWLILKKPFDNVEVKQLAHCLTQKWNLAQETRARMDTLDRLVEERTSALRTANVKNERLLAAIPSIMIGLDAEDRVTVWNGAAEQYLGHSASKVLGRPFREMDTQWNWEEISRFVTEARNRTGPKTLEDFRYRRPNGKEGFLRIAHAAIPEEGGHASGLLLLAEDISEQKILQMQLLQARKMESIGRLAAGIAHEINTPTQYIGDNIRFLKDAVDDLSKLHAEYDALLARVRKEGSGGGEATAISETADAIDLASLREEIPRAIDQSIEGVRRVAEIVKAMKEFSHPGGKEKQPSDINRAIENAVTVSRNEWRYTADLETKFDTGLPRVPILPGEFNQVVLNLIINASHAIGDAVSDQPGTRGKISIKTRRVDDWVEVLVSDTGNGIPEEARERVFDPFFTTKEAGKGTGQGLAIAYAVIVDKHLGKLDFETAIGEGTTFRIRLPINPPSASNLSPSVEVGT